jgi:acyl-CoA synthetase (AMP-forming)/AMP-acid ligase II
VTEQSIRTFLEEAVRAGRMARFWLPDRVVFVDQMPLTSAGKINKALLRSEFGSAS